MRSVVKLMASLLCRFGHEKEYLAIRDASIREACYSTMCCNQTSHEVPVKEARWNCRRCGCLGEDILKKGAWKIEFGKLLPDPKAWANWDGL